MDIREKYKNARAFIVLLAAFITWLLNMKYKRDIVKSLIILLIVIIIFYIIATIAIKLIDKIRIMEPVKQLDVSDSDQADENEISAEISTAEEK